MSDPRVTWVPWSELAYLGRLGCQFCGAYATVCATASKPGMTSNARACDSVACRVVAERTCLHWLDIDNSIAPHLPVPRNAWDKIGGDEII